MSVTSISVAVPRLNCSRRSFKRLFSSSRTFTSAPTLSKLLWALSRSLHIVSVTWRFILFCVSIASSAYVRSRRKLLLPSVSASRRFWNCASNWATSLSALTFFFDIVDSYCPLTRDYLILSSTYGRARTMQARIISETEKPDSSDRRLTLSTNSTERRNFSIGLFMFQLYHSQKEKSRTILLSHSYCPTVTVPQ